MVDPPLPGGNVLHGTDIMAVERACPPGGGEEERSDDEGITIEVRVGRVGLIPYTYIGGLQFSWSLIFIMEKTSWIWK
jgi:hypothetical protein